MICNKEYTLLKIETMLSFFMIFYYNFTKKENMEYLFKVLNIIATKYPKLLKKSLYLVMYTFMRKRKCIALTNLKLTGYNDKKLLKKHFMFLAENLTDFIKNLTLTKEELSNKIILKNADMVKKALTKGPVVYITAHYGFWEISPLATSLKLGKINIIVRDLDNKTLNSLVRKSRERFGVGVFDKRGGLKSIVKRIKQNESVGILVDQYPGDDKGLVTEFFGRKVRHTEIAAVLSKKFNIPIVVAFTDKKDDKYIIEFTDIFYTDDIQSSVDRQSEAIENYIKKDISKWYLVHKRFRPWEKYENCNS